MQSTDIAYYTYIYAKVDEQRYQTVTSWTKCATLFGRSACGIVAQLTTSYGLLDYEQLNYLTIGACSLAAVWACFLPPVEQSIYFNKRSNPPSMGATSISIINLGDSSKNRNEKTGQPENLVSPTTGALSFGAKLRHAYSLLWSDFLQAYSNRRVVKWSLWWALATCGYIQVVHNIHLLWIHAVEAQHLPKDTKIYNGAVEAIDTLTSAVMVAGIGTLRLNWSLLGEPILAIFSLIEGLLLVAFCISYKLWVLYAARIAFGVIFHSIITIANFEVAKRIAKDSKGLIFGINSFFALLFQTILTLVVIAWLKLHITSQFIIYGAYYGVLGLLFAVMSVLTITKVVRSKNPVALWITKSYECDTMVK
ncbi:thiamine transporter 1-like [Copidosoma floridanum]|uniref:thiamine transporter 1-like n=1 Tax=Copidosoma floridanum TaxID=29053 RepID=UPI000C6FA156|nr:thiamine transporter 1-like [Copidosoma floridanum]